MTLVRCRGQKPGSSCFTRKRGQEGEPGLGVLLARGGGGAWVCSDEGQIRLLHVEARAVLSSRSIV